MWSTVLSGMRKEAFVLTKLAQPYDWWMRCDRLAHDTDDEAFHWHRVKYLQNMTPNRKTKYFRAITLIRFPMTSDSSWVTKITSHSIWTTDTNSFLICPFCLFFSLLSCAGLPHAWWCIVGTLRQSFPLLRGWKIIVRSMQSSWESLSRRHH